MKLLEKVVILFSIRARSRFKTQHKDKKSLYVTDSGFKFLREMVIQLI